MPRSKKASSVREWPPECRLLLRDRKLDVEIPITLVLDEPLDCQIKPGKALTWKQVDELLARTGVREEGSPISGTDTFKAIVNVVATLAARPLGDWYEDDSEAQRLGRLIAVTSYFEPLVHGWLCYWHRVFAAAGRERGWPKEMMSISRADLQKLLRRETELVLEGLGPIAKTMKDDAKRRKILAKDILFLKDVVELTGMDPKTLHKDHINDTEKDGRKEGKLNGYKARRRWQFHRDSYMQWEENLEKQHERPTHP